MSSSGLAEPTTATIESLETQVRRRLGSRVRDLHVTIQSDGMILQGHAQTFHAKQLAQHAAMELAELPILANDIEVSRQQTVDSRQ
jgi:hypothetical protein